MPDRRRVGPKTAVADWNAHRRVRQDESRTNKALERWNGNFNIDEQRLMAGKET